jgi:transglutaminase-like putative cysteine protease
MFGVARTSSAASLLLSLLAASAAAQAPVVTPKGDPSVKSDTIYQLAVNPADYPDQPYVYLLDDGIVRFEADGTGARTYRQVIQILTRDAVDDWAEQTFSYLEGRERLRINWIRVLKPDGTVISEGPSHEQETSAPVPEAYPVYTNLKLHRVSLGGVAPGTLVDFSYTTETLDPMLTGDFSTGWRVTTGRPVRRSRFIVDVPTKLQPRIDEQNMGSLRRTVERNGRRVYTWATADVPAIRAEPFAGFPNDVSMGVTVSSPLAWDSIAHWYADLSRDRFSLTAHTAPADAAHPLDTAAVLRAVSGVVAGASTLEDSLRAVHRWIAQDIRYVSLSLGRGGYQPRYPLDVVETGFGDCKDKATLFVAIARRFGAEAYPVLANLDGEPDSLMPSIGQFDHMIAALVTPHGYRYLDLTAELIPWGEVPTYLQGEVGLLVRPNGRGELVHFPEDPPDSNRVEVTLTGEIRDDGSFQGRYAQATFGGAQYSLRNSLAGSSQYTAEQRDRVALAIANNVFEGARGDSLEIFDGRDLSATPRVSAWIEADNVTQQNGADHIFTLPMPNYANRRIISTLESQGKRRFPIDVSQVNGPARSRYALDVRLPEGWHASLPPNVTASSVFGSYTAEYTQEGRHLRIVRTMTGGRGIEPPDSVGGLIAWLRAVAGDDVKYVVLKPDGGRTP